MNPTKGRGDTTAAYSSMSSAIVNPGSHLDRTRLQKGIALTHHPPIARDLHAIIEARQGLASKHDVDSSRLRRLIAYYWRALDADKFTSGDRDGDEDGPVEDPVMPQCQDDQVKAGE